MKQFGNVYVPEKDENFFVPATGYYGYKNLIQHFSEKFIIGVEDIFPNPEKSYPDNEDRQSIHYNRNNILFRLGILSNRTIGDFKECYKDFAGHISVFSEFKSMEEAREAFRIAVMVNIVPIYLYENCRMIDKLD